MKGEGMRRKRILAIVVGLAALTVTTMTAASRVTLSALEEPGPFESWAATRAKHWLVGRAARSLEPNIPAGDTAMAIGEMRFRGECAPCHGNDGRRPTDIGRGLYPRAVDLGSPAVQAWSDRELFWIVKHGVRLTGMPAFGAALDDDEIGALVAYVRSLGRSPTAR
jgi:mono/diheme cytochrome c family protein